MRREGPEMGMYKIGTNISEELADGLDRTFLLDALKRIYRTEDECRVRDLVKMKLQSQEGFDVTAEKLGLTNPELIHCLVNTFPDMFSHKFCKFLRSSYFDRRCETCGCYMPRKKVCRSATSKRAGTRNLDKDGCCDVWEKKK